MYLRPKRLIAGYPALKLRDLFKKLYDYNFTNSHISNKLEITLKESENLINSLSKLGYIKKSEEHKKEWELTLKGQRLSSARGSHMKRRTANKIIQKILKKVDEINQDKSFEFFVLYVIIFGSYAKGASYLGDLDIYIEVWKRSRNLKIFPCTKEYKSEYIDEYEDNPYYDLLHRVGQNKILKYTQVHRNIEYHDYYDFNLCGKYFEILYIDKRFNKQEFIKYLKERRKKEN